MTRYFPEVIELRLLLYCTLKQDQILKFTAGGESMAIISHQVKVFWLGTHSVGNCVNKNFTGVIHS